MNITLNEQQSQIVGEHLNTLNRCEAVAKHEKEKLNSFVLGIASASGFKGNFTYKLENNQLLLELSPEPEPVEG